MKVMLKILFFLSLLTILIVLIANYSIKNPFTFKDIQDIILNNSNNSTISNVSNVFNNENDKIKNPRIFCLILTTANNLKTKAKAIKESWAFKCTNYTFVLSISDQILDSLKYKTNKDTIKNGFEVVYENMNLLQPPGYAVDKYNKLTDKMFSSIIYLYKHFNDYDWYLKADDDTFIFVENLGKFLSKKNKTSPVTYGYDYHCYVDRGYHSGGGGYVLSSEAFNRIGHTLNENYTNCPNSGMKLEKK